MSTSGSPTFFDDLPQVYERVAVPAMFEQEALALLERAALIPGEHVLDLACGTGIVARLAAPGLQAAGRVWALDLNPAMLAQARAQGAPDGAPVGWLRGNAMALPFADGAFDAVLCQNGLQFMPDRPLALREMRRVLRPGGRLALNVVAREAASLAVGTSAARFLGPEAMASYYLPLALGDAGELRRLFAGTGFGRVDISRQNLTGRCRSAEDFVDFMLNARLPEYLAQLSREDFAALQADARAQLASYLGPAGLEFPIEMLVVVARARTLG